jgi:hypothetical protein
MALAGDLKAMAMPRLVRAWGSVVYLFPGLHLDGLEDADSGWLSLARPTSDSMNFDQTEVWPELPGQANRLTFTAEQPLQASAVGSAFHVGTEADFQVLVQKHQVAVKGAVVERV